MPRLTPEQIAERQNFIGASDIGAIAGLNPYRDAVDVLNEKLGYAREEPDDVTSAAELGHLQEQFVLRPTYVRSQNVTLVPCGTVYHPDSRWAAATLDSKIQGLSRGLECKAVGFRTVGDWDENDDEGVPHYVRAQAAWQMWCINLDEIDVAALLGGTRFRVWRLRRDQELEKRLIELGEKFIKTYVRERKAPALTDGENVRTYLDGKYPALPAPVEVLADKDLDVIVRAREAASKLRDSHDKDYREQTAKAIAWLGEKQADIAVGDGWRFSYKPNKNGDRRPLFLRRDK